MKSSFTNNMSAQFTKAVPVWAEGMSDVMNVTVEFRTVIEKKSEVKLTCAAASVYNVYINGEFAAAGPARAAHGFYRVDSINIGDFLKKGENCVSVRVAGYNVNSFYTLDQKPFLCAEIVSDGDVAAVFEQGSVEADGNDALACLHGKCREPERKHRQHDSIFHFHILSFYF